MSKQVNLNIGHITCPICAQVAAVRKNRGGRFYFDCMHCGRLYPNHSGGQKFILDKAVIWGGEGAPADVPAWIREQWPYGKAVRHRNVEAPPAEVCMIDPPAAANEAPAPAAPGELPPPPARQQPEPDTAEPPAAADSWVFL